MAGTLRLIILILLTAAAVAGCTSQGDTEGPTPPATGELVLVGSLDWSMPERFGLDIDEDGRLDIPNTLEYVLNVDPGRCGSDCGDIVPVYAVVLDASSVALVDGAGREAPIDSYGWTVSGTGGVQAITGETSQIVVELPEGAHRVALEVSGGGQTLGLQVEIDVKDILIVSIGDSFASGEGNPDVPGDPPQWADDGMVDGSLPELAHDVAHRSTLSGPVQAALQIERGDPHSSVTFVFLAASGASIDKGMLDVGDAAVGGDGERRVLRPQLEVLAELVGCDPDRETCQREIDALLISAGGNDIGFSFTLGSLIALDPVLVVNPIYSNLLENLAAEVEAQIEDLPALFEDLAEAMGVMDVAAVYLTAYPDSSSVAEGGRVLSCESVGGDLVFGLEIDREELDLVRDRLATPLNEMLRSIADAQGWSFVDGHLESFRGHGYCGSDPYDGGSYAGSPHPDLVSLLDEPGVRWFRQANDSVVIQGGGGSVFSPDRLGTNGTFHPNEYGHQAYKEAVVAALGY